MLQNVIKFSLDFLNRANSEILMNMMYTDLTDLTNTDSTLFKKMSDILIIHRRCPECCRKFAKKCQQTILSFLLANGNRRADRQEEEKKRLADRG